MITISFGYWFAYVVFFLSPLHLLGVIDVIFLIQMILKIIET